MKCNEYDKDARENKLIAVIGYIIFLLPLIFKKKSRFAKFHANQSLLILILLILVNVVGKLIPTIGNLMIIPIGNFVVVILIIMGVVNVLNCKMKELPLIGKITIIK